MNRTSLAQIAEALRRNLGLPAQTARELGMSRQALERRNARSPHLKAALHDIRETRLDMAEGVLLLAVNNKDLAASQWMLERLGKHRGFNLRTELTGKDGAAIDLNTAVEGLTDEQADLLERLVATGPGRP